MLVTIAAKIKDEATNRIRGIDAVTDHGIPGGIALGGLVLAKGL